MSNNVDNQPQGFTLDLRGGLKLRAMHVPNRKKPYLGIEHGNKFIALAQFISDDEMEFLWKILKGRVFIIETLPLDEVAEAELTD